MNGGEVHPRKITSEIFQVGGSGFTSSDDAAVYLIVQGDGAALVDAGSGRGHDRLIQAVRACGVNPEAIRYLLLTHCHYDHTGGACRLRDETGCLTIMHELEAPYLEGGDNSVTAADWYDASITPCPVDIKLTGAISPITLEGMDITAYHTPGHSPGSVAYVTESDGITVLFGQDVHGPLHPSLLSMESDYIQSLKRLLELDADILCEGHYGIYEGKDKVRAFIETYLREYE